MQQSLALIKAELNVNYRYKIHKTLLARARKLVDSEHKMQSLINKLGDKGEK